jgi:hypothetical protein
MRRFLGLAALVLAVTSCQDGTCPFDELNYTVKNSQNDEEVATITAQGCSTDNANVAISPEYVGRVYFNESVTILGIEPYHAFEMGSANTRNVELIENTTKHIIEVIHKSTLANNLNNPYPISTDDFKLSGQEGSMSKTGSANIQLNGHPLQLILSLQNVDDEGGAKTWRFQSAKYADTNEEIPLDDVDWECFFDNGYTYMKGNRFRYNPNGTLCNKEKDFFTDVNDPGSVYGQYSIEINENNNPEVVLEVIESPDDTRKERIEILSWDTNDWNTITIKVKNPENEEEVIAVMSVSETVEWSEF